LVEEGEDQGRDHDRQHDDLHEDHDHDHEAKIEAQDEILNVNVQENDQHQKGEINAQSRRRDQPLAIENLMMTEKIKGHVVDHVVVKTVMVMVIPRTNVVASHIATTDDAVVCRQCGILPFNRTTGVNS